MKKQYISPTLTVVPLQTQSELLLYSVRGVTPVTEEIVGDADEDKYVNIIDVNPHLPLSCTTLYTHLLTWQRQ